jgi:hypothetical protein
VISHTYSVGTFSFNVTEDEISITTADSTQVFKHPTGIKRFTVNVDNKQKITTIDLENVILQVSSLALFAIDLFF